MGLPRWLKALTYSVTQLLPILAAEELFLYLRLYFKDFISCWRGFLPAHDFHGDAWGGCIHSFAVLIEQETHFGPGLPCNQNTAFPQSSSLDDGCGEWTSEEQRRKVTDKIQVMFLPVFMACVGTTRPEWICDASQAQYSCDDLLEHSPNFQWVKKPQNLYCTLHFCRSIQNLTFVNSATGWFYTWSESPPKKKSNPKQQIPTTLFISKRAEHTLFTEPGLRYLRAEYHIIQNFKNFVCIDC